MGDKMIKDALREVTEATLIAEQEEALDRATAMDSVIEELLDEKPTTDK